MIHRLQLPQPKPVPTTCSCFDCLERYGFACQVVVTISWLTARRSFGAATLIRRLLFFATTGGDQIRSQPIRACHLVKGGKPRRKMSRGHMHQRPEFRKTEIDACDAALGGFGVRVLFSGRQRNFIHTRTDGERVWQNIGNTDEIRMSEACEPATGLPVAIRMGLPGNSSRASHSSISSPTPSVNYSVTTRDNIRSKPYCNIY